MQSSRFYSRLYTILCRGLGSCTNLGGETTPDLAESELKSNPLDVPWLKMDFFVGGQEGSIRLGREHLLNV